MGLGRRYRYRKSGASLPVVISFGAESSPNSFPAGYESVIWNPVLELWFICSRQSTVNRIQTSPNGSSWTVRNPAVQRTPYDIAYNPSGGRTVFIATTGGTTKGHYTDDGVNYTLVNAASNAWIGIEYGGTSTQFFYATNTQGTNNKGKSTDNGENFTLINGLVATTGANEHIKFLNSLWIFNAGANIYYSSDNADNFSSSSLTCYNFDFGNGVFVLTGNNRQIYTSTNLSSFTTITIDSGVLATTQNITIVKYCDGIWLFGTQTGTFFYSYNLTDFFLIQVNNFSGTQFNFRKIDYDPVSKLVIIVALCTSTGANTMYKIQLG